MYQPTTTTEAFAVLMAQSSIVGLCNRAFDEALATGRFVDILCARVAFELACKKHLRDMVFFNNVVSELN